MTKDRPISTDQNFEIFLPVEMFDISHHESRDKVRNVQDIGGDERDRNHHPKGGQTSTVVYRYPDTRERSGKYDVVKM